MALNDRNQANLSRNEIYKKVMNYCLSQDYFCHFSSVSLPSSRQSRSILSASLSRDPTDEEIELGREIVRDVVSVSIHVI